MSCNKKIYVDNRTNLKLTIAIFLRLQIESHAMPSFIVDGGVSIEDGYWLYCEGTYMGGIGYRVRSGDGRSTVLILTYVLYLIPHKNKTHI